MFFEHYFIKIYNIKTTVFAFLYLNFKVVPLSKSRSKCLLGSFDS